MHGEKGRDDTRRSHRTLLGPDTVCTLLLKSKWVSKPNREPKDCLWPVNNEGAACIPMIGRQHVLLQLPEGQRYMQTPVTPNRLASAQL